MWQLEEVNKVGLNVIQKGSEGYIGEVLHYCHPGMEREKCLFKEYAANQTVAYFQTKEEQMRLTVKWLRSLDLEHQGQIQTVSSARLQYIYANRVPTS